MDYTLIVEIYKPFKDLGDINANEVLWEFAKALANIVKRPVLAVFEDDIQIVTRLDVSFILDDVGVLSKPRKRVV